jgi:hypothetical protein
LNRGKTVFLGVFLILICLSVEKIRDKKSKKRQKKYKIQGKKSCNAFTFMVK